MSLDTAVDTTVSNVEGALGGNQDDGNLGLSCSGAHHLLGVWEGIFDARSTEVTHAEQGLFSFFLRVLMCN